MNDALKNRAKKILGLDKKTVQQQSGQRPGSSQITRPPVEPLGSMANGSKSVHSDRSAFGAVDHPIVISERSEIQVSGSRIVPLSSPQRQFESSHSIQVTLKTQDPKSVPETDERERRIDKRETGGSHANGFSDNPDRKAFGTTKKTDPNNV